MTYLFLEHYLITNLGSFIFLLAQSWKMKLFYLSFLLLFALVFAQDEVTIEPPQSRCYSGSIENGTGEILERECDFRMVRPISVHCDGETANDTLDFYIILLPFWLLCYRNELLRRTTKLAALIKNRRSAKCFDSRMTLTMPRNKLKLFSSATNFELFDQILLPLGRICSLHPYGIFGKASRVLHFRQNAFMWIVFSKTFLEVNSSNYCIGWPVAQPGRKGESNPPLP